jgi:hypothetical protein
VKAEVIEKVIFKVINKLYPSLNLQVVHVLKDADGDNLRVYLITEYENLPDTPTMTRQIQMDVVDLCRSLGEKAELVSFANYGY